MNAVIYCRVSHEKQVRGRDYTSLDVQKEECLRFLYDRFPNAEVVDIIMEVETAGNPHRPGLQRIVDMVEAGAVDLVVVYMWSRLVRDARTSMHLRDLCHRRSVKIRCAREEMVNALLEQMESGDDMQCWMAEFMLFNFDHALRLERLQISKRTRENMRRRVQEGRYPGGTTPFGYLLTRDGLVPDPETAPLVQDAYRIFLETHSIARVRDYLAMMCPQRKWYAETIRNLLSNEKYIGIFRWGGIEIEGGIPALVDRQTWEQVQQLRVFRTRRVSNRPDFDWYLRGRIRCACGYPMTGWSVYGNKWTPYYLCLSQKYAERRRCGIKYVNARRVHDAVLRAVEAIADATWLDVICQPPLSVSEEQNERARLQSQLEQIRRQIDALIAAVASEGEARAAVRRIRELEEQERELQIRLAMLPQEEVLDASEVREVLREFSLDWEFMTDSERREVMSLLVYMVRVRSREEYDIQLAIPHDLNYQQVWLPTHRLVQTTVSVIAPQREPSQVTAIRIGG